MGCVLYELCALGPPFDAPSMLGLMHKIEAGAYEPVPQLYSADVHTLVAACLDTSHTKRPTVP
eukprot:2338575-Prymnesium_polylepis.1